MFFFTHAKKFHDPCTDKLARGQKTVQSDWTILLTYVLGSNYQCLTWVLKENFHLIALSWRMSYTYKRNIIWKSTFCFRWIIFF